MAISCVYCGSQHDEASQVRACWQRSQGSVDPDSDTRTSTTTRTDTRTDAGARSITTSRTTIAAMPQLGRNAVVRDGQPNPPGWDDDPRFVVQLDDAELIHQLRQRADQRSPVVFQLSDAVAERLTTAACSDDPPHVLGPRYTFVDQELCQLVFANSVDWRDGISWALLDLATRGSAAAVTEGAGDIALADGQRLWLDGGPFRFTEAIHGVAVVHRITVEHGSLLAPTDNVSTALLADDQLAAVTHIGGSARVIAPAGSGKTRVLTERARHLINRWNVPPSAICLVAFNKRAQEEIVARTRDLPGLQVRTLNATALAIINGSGPFASQTQRWNTIDEPEVRRIIGRLVSFPRKRNADPVATWIEAMSLARLGLNSPATVEGMYDGEVDGFADVLPRFRAALASAGNVDFDEQIQRAIELLLRDPRTRSAAQRSSRVLLVDEFQDLTPAHLLMIRLLAGPDGAVFGVGDDDQTIYGYNGADPAWLIDFAELFPASGQHPLEVNYRCPSGVVSAASTLLRHNHRRVAKTIRAANTQTDGFTVAAPSIDTVGVTVAAISQIIANGSAPADIAVLTRVNSLLAPVQVALHAVGIATSGGVGKEFLERTAMRSAIAWLRLATVKGDFDPADVVEALRRPSRPLHPRIAGWVGEQTSIGALRKLSARITTERDAERIDGFTDDIERLQRLASTRGTTATILAALRDSMGLAMSIASLDTHRRGMNRAAQNDDLTAIAQLAELQPNPLIFESWLRDVLSVRWQPGGVTLATVHRVKGQEWPYVIVHHADADQFPHRLADDDEEERRVFHVALTRASSELLIVPSDRPSPFILECSTEPPPRAPRAGASTAIAGRSLSSRSANSPAAATVRPGQGLDATQTSLFEELRSLRRHLAAGKPAYTVLADAALHEIAIARPTSIGELATIRGIGPAKLDRYGSAIIATVLAAE